MDLKKHTEDLCAQLGVPPGATTSERFYVMAALTFPETALPVTKELLLKARAQHHARRAAALSDRLAQTPAEPTPS